MKLTAVQHGKLPLFLALYFFVFLLSETFLQNHMAAAAGTAAATSFFSASLFCLAAGYLGLPLCRPWRGASLNRLAMAGTAVIALCFAGLPCVHSTTLLCLTGLVCSCCLGGVGGVIHYAAALQMAGSAHTGRLVGWTISAAVLAQFLVERCLTTATQGLVLAAASTALTCLFLRWPCPFAPETATSPRRGPSRRTLGCTVLGVGCMSVIFGFHDGVVTALHATGAISVTDWPRLFYAGGLLLAGGIADIRRRAYLPVVTLCVFMQSTLAVFLLSRPEYHVFNLALLYFYGGFYVVYFTVIFLDLAPETQHPLLWAGMGRICRSLCAGVVVLGAPQLCNLLGHGGVIALSSLLLAALCGIFFWSGQLAGADGRRDAATPTEPVGEDRESTMRAFAAQHALTKREAEVLTAVLSSREPLNQIAGTLHLSERVLQRHLTSIYSKSGVGSRVGLLTLFYGKR